MKYEYECEKCKEKSIVIKPIEHSSREEYCKDCKSLLKRVFSMFGAKTGDGYKA